MQAAALALPVQTFESCNQRIEQVTDGWNHASARGEDRMYKTRRGSQIWQQVLQAPGLNIGLNQFPGQHCHPDAGYRRNPQAGQVVGRETGLMHP